MTFTIKSIHPVTGTPRGFTYNGKVLGHLSFLELRGALSEVLADNLRLKHQRDVHLQMTKERVYGIESELKEINWEKLAEQFRL